MATSQFPINNVSGVRSFGPSAVPANAVSAQIALDGSTMTNPALAITLSLDFSLDGVAWAGDNPGPETNPYPISMTLVGGALDKHGNPLAVYSLGAPLPHPEIAARQIRGVVNVTGGALTTVATLAIT